MNTCYVSTLITFLLFLLAFVQAIFHFPIFKANHVTFMILTSIVYFFTETLVIFFFVGTGVSVKEYTIEHNLSHTYHQRSIAVKRKIYPPLLLNILFMSILFVMVGAVDTFRVPIYIYLAFFIFCVWHYLRMKIVEHESFRENTNIILEMSGIKR